MSNIVFAPAVPHNPSNYMIPSRISIWWRTLLANGSLDTPIELGSVSELSFTPNEATADLKSDRLGILTTSQRVITEVSGTFSFKIHEIAGTNVNLLFRPVTTQSLTGGSGVVINGASRVRLSGTTPAVFAPEALEFDPSTGLTSYPTITLVRVESTAVANPSTGRGTAYTTADYTFTQVATATTYFIKIKTTSTNHVAPDFGSTLTINDVARAYDATNGTTPTIGETLSTDVGATTVLLVGWVSSSASAGTIWYRNLAGGTVDDNDVLTGATSGATFTVNGAALTAGTAVVVSYQGGTDDGQLLLSIGTLANITAVQFATIVGQATGAASLSGGSGIKITGASSYAGYITYWAAGNAQTQATLARVSGGAIPDGAEVVVQYTYQRNGKSYSILDGVLIEGELQVQVLSLNGPQSIYRFFRGNINIEGALSMNPEERMEPQLQFTILPDGTGRRGEFVLLDGFGRFSISA